MSIDVLLLSDDHETQLLAKELLERDNPDFQFTLSASSQEALEILAEKDIDVVVSGVDLGPKADSGLDFLGEARARGIETPIIILTGCGREETVVKALNLGADHYIRKDPVKIKGVYTEVAHHIRKLAAKRQLEADLDASEERFRTVFEQGAIGMTVVDKNDNMLQANRALADMLEYELDELLEFNVIDFSHPDDWEKDKKLAEKAIENNKNSYQMKKRFIKKDGSIFWGRLTVSLVYDEHGEFKYDIGFVEDIDERKRAEQALRESEALFRGIFNSSPIAIEIFDASGKLIRANQATLDLFGLDSLDRLLDFNIFEDKNTPDRVKEALKQGDSVRYSVSFDFDTTEEPNLSKTSKTGTIHLEAIAAPLKKHSRDEIKGYLTQIIDITDLVKFERALERSRARYQRLYNNALVGLFRSELGSGRILECNERAARMIGYTNREEILTNQLTTNAFYTNPEDRESVIELLETKERTVMDIPVTRKDGSQFWGRFFFRAYHDEGFVEAVMIDITEEKDATERIQRQREELSRFAHHMSHDIKNYLHKIAANVELWEQYGNGEYSTKIKELVAELNKLTVHSVELADSGVIIKDPEPVDLSSVITAVAGSQLPPSVAFTSKNLPVVSGDATKLTQVFQNIMDNALKHGNAKHIEVVGYENGSTITIEISNDGEPFPEDLKDEVFRDANWLGTKKHGFGLRIVKRIIHAHGWSIDLTSTDPTTFEIKIPVP